MKLQNRVALVTGVAGTQGLGHAIADAFGREGARLAIADLNEAAVMERAAEFRANGVDCLGIRCDVSSLDDVRAMFAKVVARFSTLDILVNNAALVPNRPDDDARRERFYRYLTTPMPRQSIGITVDLPDEEWLKWWGVNVHGVFWCTREALKIMQPRRYGRIVNIASVAGISTAGAHAPGYAASKAAVVSLTRTVAVDVAGDNIFVNAICPGAVRTAAFDALITKLGPDATNALYQLIPAGRLGERSEYAAMAVHLASDETYCVGQAITPNGGIVI